MFYITCCFISTYDQKLLWRYYNGKPSEAMDGVSKGLFGRKVSKENGEKNVFPMLSIGKEAGKWRRKRLGIRIRTQ